MSDDNILLPNLAGDRARRERALRKQLERAESKLEQVEGCLQAAEERERALARSNVELRSRLDTALRLLDTLETWEHPDDPALSIIDSKTYLLIEQVEEVLKGEPDEWLASAVEGRVPRSQDEANEIAYETGQTDGIQCPKRTILHGVPVECVLYEGHAGECYWQAAADEGQEP